MPLIQQHWVDCVKAGREPDTSGRDNLQTFGLVEAVYESARSGRTVALADILTCPESRTGSSLTGPRK